MMVYRLWKIIKVSQRNRRVFMSGGSKTLFGLDLI
jgi:hypothetical protein